MKTETNDVGKVMDDVSTELMSLTARLCRIERLLASTGLTKEAALVGNARATLDRLAQVLS